MVKRNFSFSLVTGIGVGTALGIALDNIPMGVSTGAAGSLLILLLSIFEKDKDN